MKNRIFFFLFLLLARGVTAQEVRLKLDRTRILIGEQIRMDIEADFASDINWLAIDSLSHFEILSRSKVDTVRTGTLSTLRQQFVLTSWDSGRWQLPALAIGSARTKPVVIDVGFSKMDPNQDYHDVKDIIAVKRPQETSWQWYALFAAILIILFLLFFPKEKKKKEDVFVSDEGAYKAALRKLEQLRAARTGNNKELYTALIQIFREYLEKRKNIRSFSRTTDDLAIQISALNLNRDQFSELVQMLRLSDLVKFAQMQPTEEENDDSIRIAEENIKSIEKLN